MKRTTKLFREFLKWLKNQDDLDLYEKDPQLCIVTAFLKEKHPDMGYLTDSYDYSPSKNRYRAWIETRNECKFLLPTEQRIYNKVNEGIHETYTVAEVRVILTNLGYIKKGENHGNI